MMNGMLELLYNKAVTVIACAIVSDESKISKGTKPIEGGLKLEGSFVVDSVARELRTNFTKESGFVVSSRVQHHGGSRCVVTPWRVVCRWCIVAERWRSG